MRKPSPTPLDASDSEALHEAIQGMIDSRGRGGLTYVAEKLGVTPSMLQKRLRAPGKAFDAPTLRASILVMQEHIQPPDPTANTQAPEPTP